MLESLVRLEERLALGSLDIIGRKCPAKLVAMAVGKLRNQTRRPGQSVLCRRAGLAKFDPMRWLRRRGLRTLLTSIDVAQDDPAISSFHKAAKMEVNLRPLRAQLEEYFTSLFGRAPDTTSRPGSLPNLSGNLHSILTDVHSHVTVIDRCPNRTELDQAAMTGKIEGLEGFFDGQIALQETRCAGGKPRRARSSKADTSMKHGSGRGEPQSMVVVQTIPPSLRSWGSANAGELPGVSTPLRSSRRQAARNLPGTSIEGA